MIEKQGDDIQIGDWVQIIDKYDMNYKCKGFLSERDAEWDIEQEGKVLQAVKVSFPHTINFQGREIKADNVVPYYMHQLKKIKKPIQK